MVRKVPKEDRILVILSIHLEDDVDVALGRAFCRGLSACQLFPAYASGVKLHCDQSTKRDS